MEFSLKRNSFKLIARLNNNKKVWLLENSSLSTSIKVGKFCSWMGKCQHSLRLCIDNPRRYDCLVSPKNLASTENRRKRVMSWDRRSGASFKMRPELNSACLKNMYQPFVWSYWLSSLTTTTTTDKCREQLPVSRHLSVVDTPASLLLCSSVIQLRLNQYENIKISQHFLSFLSHISSWSPMFCSTSLYIKDLLRYLANHQIKMWPCCLFLIEVRIR